MDITARGRFVRTAPDKVRILTSMIKGKTPDSAIAQLQFSGKYAAKPLILVIKQAKDQVKDKGEDVETYKISEVRVDEGPKLKRRRIRHQGRATAILKRASHLTVKLSNVKEEKKEENGTQS